jgi:hypothetical protein
VPLIPLFAGPIIAALIATVALPAQAGERDQLNACKAKVDRAAQMQAASAADDADLGRCRQIIKEWTLRDSRMNVDENGRRLR